MNNYYFEYCNEVSSDDAILSSLAVTDLRHKYDWDTLNNMTKDERFAVMDECDEFLMKQSMDDMWDAYYDIRNMIDTINHNAYYYENIKAFKEYESHMGEPDFDWDYYSDWHKDMYGYRPR